MPTGQWDILLAFKTFQLQDNFINPTDLRVFLPDLVNSITVLVLQSVSLHL